jgi:dethiobiotin synthetase
MRYFVTGINTGSGKTIVSAILCHALQADYWKPIQTGTEERDFETVKSLVNNDHCLFFEEAFRLNEPASPHQAAHMEGVTIDLDQIQLPDNDGNDIVIEGAGGVLVPLNNDECIIDLAKKFAAEVILVSNFYLGSVNHTLLTINELQRRGLKIKGIVFNGPLNSYSREIIVQKSGLTELLYIEPEEDMSQEIITKYAVKLFQNW